MKILWKFFLALRFYLFQRRRYRHLVIETVRGKPFVVLPEVFNPALFPTGDFLAEHYAQIAPDASVLDMGTGSGVGAVLAAGYANRVTAVDINPHAVRCATINALLNRLEHKITVRQSDLFDALDGERFDVVLFNPPFFRGAPKDPEDHAWRGVEVVERFLACLRQHLTPNGYALIVFSTNSDYPQLAALCETYHFNVEVVAKRDIISEILTVYRLTQL